MIVLSKVFSIDETDVEGRILEGVIVDCVVVVVAVVVVVVAVVVVVIVVVTNRRNIQNLLSCLNNFTACHVQCYYGKCFYRREHYYC